MEPWTYLPPLELKELKPRAPELARLLKCLAHPDRLVLLSHLASGERSVAELSRFCQTIQPVTSQALAKLKSEGWISSRRDGQQVFYRLSDPRVAKLLRSLKELFCHSAEGFH